MSYYYTLIRRGLYAGDFGPFLRLFLAGDVDGYGPWHEHVRSWLESPLHEDGSLLALRYEDMLADPADNLCAAMEFLGVPVERERAEQTISEYTAERMRERERRTRASTSASSGRTSCSCARPRRATGPRRSPREDEELFLSATGGLLERLGYSSPAQWPGAMRILIVNKYARVTGGADVVALGLAEGLREPRPRGRDALHGEP